MLFSDHAVRHHITYNAVDLEVRHISGCDPYGFDLGDFARHRLVWETIADLVEDGVEVQQKHWAPLHGGGVDRIIAVANTTDGVFAQLKLG